ncbi:hypothetical protein KSS87_013042 [Heliosperma pusillum]|nr:hypothetical protein KSS87_013042 [Heliosperma pusillum]
MAIALILTISQLNIGVRLTQMNVRVVHKWERPEFKEKSKTEAIELLLLDAEEVKVFEPSLSTPAASNSLQIIEISDDDDDDDISRDNMKTISEIKQNENVHIHISEIKQNENVHIHQFQVKFVVSDASNEEADFMVFDTQISQFITHTTAELLAKIEKEEEYDSFKSSTKALMVRIQYAKATKMASLRISKAIISCRAKGFPMRSGFNESMKLTEAQSLYEQIYGNTFNFMHVWDLVGTTEKWTEENRKNKEISGHSAKRNKTSVSGEYTSSGGDVSVTEERSEIRPTGRDAAKKAQSRKGKGRMSENDYSETMSMAKNIEETRAMSASRLADIKEQEIEERLICADVSKMTPLQRKIHHKKLEEITAKRGINIDDFLE